MDFLCVEAPVGLQLLFDFGCCDCDLLMGRCVCFCAF